MYKRFLCTAAVLATFFASTSSIAKTATVVLEGQPANAAITYATYAGVNQPPKVDSASLPITKKVLASDVFEFDVLTVNINGSAYTFEKNEKGQPGLCHIKYNGDEDKTLTLTISDQEKKTIICQ